LQPELLNFKELAMKRNLFALFLLASVTAMAQPLRDINYNYLYNPDSKFTFELKPVRVAGGWKIIYSFLLKEAGANIDEYSIQWETRYSVSDKEGSALTSPELTETKRTATSYSGFLLLKNEPSIIAAKVTNSVLKRAWYFHAHLEAKYPVNAYLSKSGETITKPFINSDDNVSIETTAGPLTVSYYNDAFPPAALIFSESQARVAKEIKTDSVFTISPSGSFQFSKKGLYLIQQDTNSDNGICFRAEEDYPRYNKVQNLAGPLIYICTKQEFDRLELARGDKQAFDKVILNMTGDTDRARSLIRTYFKRVELANLYFTSYKEGWKTDRGMIYIIFGLPDEVYRINDREVWKYDNESFKVSFDFVKSGTIFDPDNYVLIREKKYQQTWYEVVDLWRNARF
jgi:GWxTD domain-containing protein